MQLNARCDDCFITVDVEAQCKGTFIANRCYIRALSRLGCESGGALEFLFETREGFSLSLLVFVRRHRRATVEFNHVVQQ